MKRKLNYLIIYLFLLLSPISVFAYQKVIPGGETIGIEVHSKGVLVVGFYKVDGQDIAQDAGFKVGDIITKVNNKSVYNISTMTKNLQETTTNEDIKFNIIRSGKYRTINLKINIGEDGLVKTGLYVKDQINGLGTLSFILEDNTFASLGHEIIESNTREKFEISEGEIYDASVSGINRSYDGNAGEKNAEYDKSEITGIIKENDITGIYGKYNKDTSDREFVSVAEPNEVSTGKATIKTVIEGENVEEFEIKIIDINKNSDTKNILFEITDERLLKETGGVVQGMSGSPIMQNNKMIGVVNYVIVNDTSKGYGIFVTKMLDKAE